jgi:hypothetical protein
VLLRPGKPRNWLERMRALTAEHFKPGPAIVKRASKEHGLS